MLTIIKTRHTPCRRIAAGVATLIIFLLFSGSVSGQDATGFHGDTNKPLAGKAARQPVASIYKELKIGTSAEQVRELLGRAKIDDKDGFFYDMESEIVQIRVDDKAQVNVISVTYSSNSSKAPNYADIFGDLPPEAKPDGSIYRLVRYPDAGYWIAYSKTGGETPVVTVTMQKL